MDAQKIFSSMVDEISSGGVHFSAHARVALQVNKALDADDCDIAHAARLIQAEPILSAKVVAVSNSVIYNRAGKVTTDVKTAIQRIGFRTVKSLATSVATRELAARTSDPVSARLSEQLWVHTAHVASLAQLIARRVTHQDPDTAMFAAIVHEIGGFYLISRAKDFPGILQEGHEFWIEYGEAGIGREVLKALEVPDAVMAAIEEFWEGFLTIPSTSLADTLVLADQLAPVVSPLHSLGDASQVQEMKANIDMAIGNDTLSGILKDSAEEIESLTAALTP